MRALVLALLLFLIIGMAGATIPTPSYANFGPYGGFSNPSVIEGKYLKSDSDAAVGGDLTVTGNLGVSGTEVNGGAISQYITTIGISNTGVIANSGTFKNGGAATVNTLAVNSTGTLTGVQTFTAAPLFNAGFVLPTGQVGDTTSVDSLKEAGVIVPTEKAIIVDEGNLTTKAIFTADTGWKIKAIREIHSVLGDAGNTYNVEKLTSGTAPGSGTNCMASTGSISSTVNTPASPALSGTPADYTLAAGDSLGVKLSANHPGALRGAITIYLTRV